MANHLNIGAIIYPEMDQIDFTGPFEVLSRLPDSTFQIFWKEKKPFRDLRGLILTPETTLEEAPRLDVLIVPGGHGQQKLMEDEAVLGFIRNRATSARYVFSVCTGALVCGAAGLFKGIRATTHWSAFHLLPYFGAIPVDEMGMKARCSCGYNSTRVACFPHHRSNEYVQFTRVCRFGLP